MSEGPADGIVPEYQGPPDGPGVRPWTVSEMASWGIILALVVLSLIVAARYQASLARESVDNLGLEITSKYAVAAHALAGGAGAGGAGGADGSLLSSLDQQAKSPEDRVRMAIVHGEFSGRDEAVQRLETLAKDPAVNRDAAELQAVYSGIDKPEGQDWQTLHARYGWFADLAASQGKEAGSAERSRVLGAAYRVMVTMLVGGLAALAAGVAGLVLLIVGLVFWFHGRIRTRFSRFVGTETRPANRSAYVAAFAVYVVMMLGVAAALRYGLHVNSDVLELVVLPTAFFLGLFFPRILGDGWAAWRAALGLERGRASGRSTGILREMGCGIVGYLAGLPVIAVSLAIVAALSKISGTTATHPIFEQLHGGPWYIVALFVLASVWAPFTEELMFRGALFSHLRERFGWWLSAGVTSLVFAMMHPQGWVGVPALAAIALVLCGIREWRGSIVGCMTAHALHNTVTLMVVLVLVR